MALCGKHDKRVGEDFRNKESNKESKVEEVFNHFVGFEPTLLKEHDGICDQLFFVFPRCVCVCPFFVFNYVTIFPRENFIKAWELYRKAISFPLNQKKFSIKKKHDIFMDSIFLITPAYFL